MDPPGQSGWRCFGGFGLGQFSAGAVIICRDREAGTAPTHHLAVLLRRRAPHRARARLQGQYRSGGGARPRQRRNHDQNRRCGHSDLAPARLFLCAEPNCRAQACICRNCDRGHIYCADCAPYARRRSLRRAGRRYQAGRRGRIKHAERARRYRSRANKVTHHGSPPEPANASLTTEPVVSNEKPPPPGSQQPPRQQQWVCLRCGRRCSDRLRQGFLRRRVRWNRRRGPDHDDSA